MAGTSVQGLQAKIQDTSSAPHRFWGILAPSKVHVPGAFLAPIRCPDDLDFLLEATCFGVFVASIDIEVGVTLHKSGYGC